MCESHVKALLLDLDNTLVDTKGADNNAYTKVSTYLSTNCQVTNPRDVIGRFQSSLKEKEIDPDGVMTADDWRTGLWQDALGTGYSLKTFSDVYKLWKDTRIQGIFFTEDVKSLLNKLRLTYKLLLLTNGDSDIQRTKIKQCNAKEYFDAIIISGDEPHAKPHHSIFDKSFKMLSVAPYECIMIGDSLVTDIQGGLNANVRATVWINPDRHSLDGTLPRPHYSIPSILELSDVLNQIT